MKVSRLDGYANEALVTKRVIEGIEFVLSCGNEDLNTYMEVNEPATGVVTERPSFTNIEDGIGIFGSKYQVSTISPFAFRMSKSHMCVVVFCAQLFL